MNTSTRMALRAQGLHVSLGRRPVLQDVNATFAAGRWTSIVGPNGAGKSSLLKVLAGVLPAAQGQVFWFDQPVQAMHRRARAQQLAWLGQSEAASDDVRVWDVVMLGRLPHQDWLAGPSAQDHAEVMRALHATQSWDWRERRLGALSGGERQRVLLARALAVQAQVLLMDEPLANLDPPYQVDWLQQMRALVAEGKTVVSVLHEIGMALQADELVLMQAGRVVFQGACAQAATHRAVEAVFEHRIAIHAVAQQWVVVPHLSSQGAV
ncbi:ABC transporter [Limnohabitans sp. JirII-29]|uniref:ABC transporter ATP-binding protein n=1 Tax=Limnohabitans sp. JirII-29 TaxID=1835756 RepID=UPI000D38BF22|nr:ABC transporter ATP-binding protein [Limnohabitans sp. JirII-29]PUE30134.1 ABC transporter [Limnohabitans sp. JirII-29]